MQRVEFYRFRSGAHSAYPQSITNLVMSMLMDAVETLQDGPRVVTYKDRPPFVDWIDFNMTSVWAER